MSKPELDDDIIETPPFPHQRPWPAQTELAHARGLLAQIRDLTDELGVRLGRLERATRGWPLDSRFASDPYERAKDRGGVRGGVGQRSRD